MSRSVWARNTHYCFASKVRPARCAWFPWLAGLAVLIGASPLAANPSLIAYGQQYLSYTMDRTPHHREFYLPVPIDTFGSRVEPDGLFSDQIEFVSWSDPQGNALTNWSDGIGAVSTPRLPFDVWSMNSRDFFDHSPWILGNLRHEPSINPNSQSNNPHTEFPSTPLTDGSPHAPDEMRSGGPDSGERGVRGTKDSVIASLRRVSKSAWDRHPPALESEHRDAAEAGHHTAIPLSRPSLLERTPSGPAVFGSSVLASSSKALRSLVSPALADDNTWNRANKNLVGPWNELLSAARGLSRRQQLLLINAQVNSRIRHRSDFAIYGVREYWSSPKETLDRGQGDCEDFAILKMWLLSALGFSADDLHIIVVESSRLSVLHAVLSVRINQDYVVLDNLSARVKSESDITEYTPIFSVNRASIWLHGFPSEQRVATSRGANVKKTALN